MQVVPQWPFGNQKRLGTLPNALFCWLKEVPTTCLFTQHPPYRPWVFSSAGVCRRAFSHPLHFGTKPQKQRGQCQASVSKRQDAEPCVTHPDCTDTVALLGACESHFLRKFWVRFFFLATDRQTKGGIKRIVFGWNRFKCIHLKHSISRPELSLTPSTFHMWPHLIFTQTGRYYYHLTDIQTEIQVKEIAGKRNVSTPKRGTNSLIQL